jgi:hypothetical protein
MSLQLRIGFSTSNAWYSRVIRWFTKSRCSHTFFVANVEGVDLAFEEGAVGWSVRTFANLSAGDTVVALLKPEHPVDAGFLKSWDELGQPYGYCVLVGMLFVMTARRLGKRIKNPFTSAHSMICSERGVRVLQDSGYPGAGELDPASTTPEDLLEFVTRGTGWASPVPPGTPRT